MFTIDVPYVPVQETPVVLAQAIGIGGTTQQPDYLLKACDEVPSMGDLTTAMNAVNPLGMLRIALQNRDDRFIDPASIVNVTIDIIEDTAHGKLIPKSTGTGKAYFMYQPDAEYIGKDRVIFMVEFESNHYKIVVDLIVSLGVDENSPQCPDIQLIKVKKPISGSLGNDLNFISLNFATLEGGALGQTDLNGITLDNNAAGHNWYVDLTPGLNEELQPPARKSIQTSNLLLASNADNEGVIASGADIDTPRFAVAPTNTITPAIVHAINKALANECVSSENQTYVKGREAHLGIIGPGNVVMATLKFAYGITEKGEVKTIVAQVPKNGHLSSLGLEVSPEFSLWPSRRFPKATGY